MFHLNFVIPSFMLLLVVLAYFLLKTRLPARMNRLFYGLMLLEVLVILFDVLSSNADMFYWTVPVPITAVLNVLFFMLFLARIFWFFLYTLNALRIFPRVRSQRMLLFSLVFLAAEVLTLASLFTGSVFRVDRMGYHRGPLYGLLYACSFFYLLLSVVLIVRRAKVLDPNQRAAAYAYNIILIVGNVARIVFPEYLVMNTFCLMSLTVIFLSFENPALYLSTTGGFTLRGLQEYLDERLQLKNYRILGFSLRNYPEAQSVYGFRQMEQGVTLIGQYLEKTYPKLLYFYLRVGCFALVGPADMDAQRIAQELGERFRRPWSAAEAELYLNVAFAEISSDSPAGSSEQIVETLMFALFDLSSREGADNLMIDLNDSAPMEQRLRVERVLERALDGDGVEVFLQPLVDAATGELVAAEALARLRDEQGGLIPPREFIPLAEKNGQINRLGEQVLEKVCHSFSEQNMQEMGLRWINVNLSPVQCMNRELCSRFLSILETSSLPPNRIHLEITETGIIDFDVLMEQMSKLWQAGFFFALDDYGSGYSNMSRVKRFPFTGIKLDMEVVHAHCKDPDRVLPTFVKVFREKGYAITAEGIEDEETAREMREIGCDYLQGYLFSRPLPIPEFLEKYAKK